MKKNIGLIIVILIVLVLIGYVIASNVVNATREVKNPIVTMEIEKFGTVEIELYPDVAPNTVANFIDLINNRYYDGLTFHRAVEGFMVQGGEKKDTTETLAIEGEFAENGYEKNTLRHDRGVLSMARSDYRNLGKVTEGYNSAYAQFFIMTDNNANVNGLYAAFGKVIKGMDVIDEISKVEAIQEKEDSTNQNSDETEEVKEDDEPKITKMTVNTFGVNYGEPKRIEAFDANKYIMEMYGISM